MVYYVSLSAGSIQSDIDRVVAFVLGTTQSAGGIKDELTKQTLTCHTPPTKHGE